MCLFVEIVFNKGSKKLEDYKIKIINNKTIKYELSIDKILCW